MLKVYDAGFKQAMRTGRCFSRLRHVSTFVYFQLNVSYLTPRFLYMLTIATYCSIDLPFGLLTTYISISNERFTIEWSEDH